MLLLREAIGDTIRRARTERRRTLRDVSGEARVSLGYLSEIERGRKEPSSELLAAICEALALSLPDLLDDVADSMRPAPVAPVVPTRLVGASRGVPPEALPAGDGGFDEQLRSAVEEAMEAAAIEGAEPHDGGATESSEAVDALEDVPGERIETAGPETDAEAVDGADDAVAGRLVPLVTVGTMGGTVVCSAA